MVVWNSVVKACLYVGGIYILIGGILSSSNAEIYALSDWPRFSYKVPIQIQETLQEDIAYLQKWKLEYTPNLNLKLSRIVHHDHIDGQSLLLWLQKRVNYIVEDNYLEQNPSPIEDLYSIDYPFSSEFPKFDKEEPIEKVLPVGKVVMSNLTPAIYLQGKLEGELKVATFREKENVSEDIIIKSPRVGILQIGEGLLQNKTIKDFKIKSLPSIFFRLSTLFHEARHGDGHGKNLGFIHAQCPKGHDYEGLPACDRNLNGPYSLNGLMYQLFLDNCIDCQEKDKEWLRLMAIESSQRVITVTKKEKINDMNVLQRLDHLDFQINLFESVGRRGSEFALLKKEREELYQKASKSVKQIPSLEVDDTAEEIND